MFLLTRPEHDTVINEVGGSQHPVFFNFFIIDVEPALSRQPSCGSLGITKPAIVEQLDYGDSRLEVGGAHFVGWNRASSPSLLGEESLGGLCRLLRGLPAMVQGRRFESQGLLSLTDIRSLESLQGGELFNRKKREEPQETADIAIVRIDPELVIVIGTGALGICLLYTSDAADE